VIGVDTNVLVRLFVEDEPQQHKAAVAFFDARSSDDPAFVSLVTVVEFCWVLKRSYKQPQSEILDLVRRVLASKDSVVELAAYVDEAVEIASRTGGDFADVVIAEAGRRTACEKTVTFDRPAARAVPGMTLLK
jgi:predicted nucleic-acid-binding protein